MLHNSSRLSLLCGRLGVQVVVGNHTIDDILLRQGPSVTKRSMRGQGPVIVQQWARHARKRALSDLNYVLVLIAFQNPQAKGLGHVDMRPWLLVALGI